VRQTDAEVLFAPGYTGPLLCAAPMVVAIHDVSFAAHPEWFSWREGLRRRTLTRLAARRAVRVLTISEFSKREITEHLGISARKIEVAYPGASVPARASAWEGPTPSAHGSRQQHVVLYVGSLFNRRHIPELIDGFARVARRRSDVRLEIVGDNRTMPAVDVEQLTSTTGIGGRLGIRAYLPEQELAAMYGHARAFVFLSEYEGFGLTPLEALAAGVPIAVLDTPVAREVYGGAALYIPRADPVLVEAAIERILFDDVERTRILTAAPATLAKYSWTECAQKVLGVLVASARERAS
jgi:glycosyltransferase involved in cell wall biosynthesis